MVVQRYLDKPLLVDNLKFDLRMYVVIIGLKEGEMKAFLANEGLARFCTTLYEKPDKDNMKQMFMHLTNFSLNKQSENFHTDPPIDDIYLPNNASKRTLTALY